MILTLFNLLSYIVCHIILSQSRFLRKSNAYITWKLHHPPLGVTITLYTTLWKFVMFICTLLGGWTQRVTQVACGWRHTVVITMAGNVYSWGRGTSGQLGHGDIQDRWSPSLTHTFARVILKATMLFKGLWACAGGLRGENELNWKVKAFQELQSGTCADFNPGSSFRLWMTRGVDIKSA